MKPLRDGEKIALALVVLLLAFFFLGCRKPSLGPAAPTTLPTPGATPAPVFSEAPLRTSGGYFVGQSGRRVFLSGAVFCCQDSKRWAWPLVSEAGLRQTSEHAGGYATIRVGPSVGLEGAEFDAYERAGSRWDVTRFREDYFARLGQIADAADALGIDMLEVDIADSWVLRQGGISPWLRENNVNGIDAGDCSIQQAPPRAVHVAFVRKVVESMGHAKSVTWHVSNEISLCGGGATRAWVDGIERVVRETEDREHFMHHLFGSNAEEGEVRRSPAVQYVTVHEPDHTGPIFGKPTLVNEYRDDFTPDAWEAQARLAKKAGSGFALWRGDLSDSDFNETLRRMALLGGY